MVYVALHAAATCLGGYGDSGVFVTGTFGDEASAGSRTAYGAGAFDVYVGRLER